MRGNSLHSRRRARTPISIAVLACGLVLGCGDGDETSSVSGKISYNGAAPAGGLINFKPATGHPLGGAINADGAYEFQLPPGSYQVRIDVPSPMPAGWKEGDPIPQLPPRVVPDKYASFATSGLTVDVNQGQSQTIDFVLP